MIQYVFFFKQKTAYELRISDWSSDVCSSDLLRILRQLVAVAAMSALLWWLMPLLAAHYSGGAFERAWSLSALVAAGGTSFFAAAWVEIGRASCRERVCQ